ncbi:MAG: AAA family ATPase, partial [Actinomycetota bacterium]|nr:AAA family ATPase [Actinomycetota bacterium]
MGIPGQGVYEREHVREAIQRVLDSARRGAGSSVLIEGEAGIGKSRMLDFAIAEAQAAGFRIGAARASEFERDFPFGTARTALEPLLRQLDAEERSGALGGAASLASRLLASGEPPEAAPFVEQPSGDRTFAALHGLYWLCANLAEAQPLLLAVDDAQWADEYSVRFLAYVARRLEGLSIALAVTRRSGRAAAEFFDAAMGDAWGEQDVLAPLSAGAVAELVSEQLGAPVDREFGEACHDATGGNPFLVSELCAALKAEAIEPRAESIPRVATLAPATISRYTLTRLVGLPPNVTDFARAAALLGELPELRHVSAVAGVDLEAGARSADTLEGIGVLKSARPIEFAHPIVRSSIVEDLAPAGRALAHRRAAQALAEDGVAADRVAVHLLESEPQGEDWAVTALRKAGASAFSRGAVDVARRYLERAVVELGGDEP